MTKRKDETPEEYKARCREYNRARPKKPSQAKFFQIEGTCGWCEKQFSLMSRNQLSAMNQGKAIYCSEACRSQVQYERKLSTIGPCPECGKMFQSSQPKRFCSIECYAASPELAERLAKYNDAKKLPPNVCPNCECEVTKKKRKFCNDICRREFFASRFDRWIASPQGLALPQCFDEFLTQESLPCLIAGCDWVGQKLGHHVNVVHGITAEKFKEIAGFNKSTGLTTPAVFLARSEMLKMKWEEGKLEQLRPFEPGHESVPHKSKLRLEGREHVKKARVIAMLTMAANETTGKCRECGETMSLGLNGQRLYCSTKCRSVFYSKQRIAELICDYCGSAFEAKREQVARRRNGLKVCCSNDCRYAMNMAACLSSRGIEMQARSS